MFSIEIPTASSWSSSLTSFLWWITFLPSGRPPINWCAHRFLLRSFVRSFVVALENSVTDVFSFLAARTKANRRRRCVLLHLFFALGPPAVSVRSLVRRDRRNYLATSPGKRPCSSSSSAIDNCIKLNYFNSFQLNYVEELDFCCTTLTTQTF